MVRIRKGLGAGRGKGYKNIIPGYDKRIHEESGAGMKQPQRMPVIAQYIRKPQPEPVVKEVNGDFLTEVAESQEKKPSKVVSVISKVGSRAYAAGAAFVKQRQAVARQKAREQKVARIEELRDLEHPLVKKYDKIQGEIDSVEARIEAGAGDDDINFERLEELKARLEEAAEHIENAKLETFTDSQLKALAVRDTGGDSLLSMDSGNKYERELVRRVEYRRDLDRKLREAQKAKKTEEGGLFDF